MRGAGCCGAQGGEIPFPLAHGFAESREAKVFPRPAAPALGRRVLVTEKLIRSLCAAPIGAARFCMGAGWDGTVHGWGTLGSDF